MKKILTLLLLCLCTIANAQTYMNVNRKDGTITKINVSKIESVTWDTETQPTEEHKAVDLGLSVKWAACNMGATSPEDYGLYFAWGETTGYTSDTSDGHIFNWINYKWSNDSETTMTKYCVSSTYGTVDNITALEPADDAATVNWGSYWHMPTYSEITELSTKCKWTKTIFNGVNGYIVEGTNGNSIFLPAAGIRSGSKLFYEGSVLALWSNSISPANSSLAYHVYINDTTIIENAHSLRLYGLNIRPVCSFDQKKTPNCTFDVTNYTMKVGEGYTQTVTTNSDGAVTYTSSDSSVASVDPSSGVVTAKSSGTTIITANVTSTDTYEASTASYTIIVEDASFYNVYYGCTESIPSTFSTSTCQYKSLSTTSANTTISIQGGNKCLWIALPKDIFHLNSITIGDDGVNILAQFQQNAALMSYTIRDSYIIYSITDNGNPISSVNTYNFNVVSGATTYYTLTYEDYDGTVLYIQHYMYGTTPIEPLDPDSTRDGYTFDSWSPAISTVTGDCTYTATYVSTTTTYTITWNPNGGNWSGSTANKTTTVTSGNTITAPTTSPTRSGYTFKGWARTSTATSALSSLGTATANTTFYAVWAESGSGTLSYYAYTGCSASYPTTVAAIEAGQKNTLSSSTNTLKAQAGGNYTYWVAIPSQFYLIGAQDNVSAEGSLQDFWNTRVTVGDYTVYYHTNSGMYADGQTFTFTESSNPGTGTFTVKYYSEYSVNIGSEQVSWGNSPVNIPKTYIENETTYTITSWIVDPTGKTIVADARFVVKESVEGSASEAKTYSVLSATYADDDF